MAKRKQAGKRLNLEFRPEQDDVRNQKKSAKPDDGDRKKGPSTRAKARSKQRDEGKQAGIVEGLPHRKHGQTVGGVRQVSRKEDPAANSVYYRKGPRELSSPWNRSNNLLGSKK